MIGPSTGFKITLSLLIHHTNIFFFYNVPSDLCFMFTHTFERQNCTMCPLQQYSSYIIWRQKLELEKTTVVGMMEWQDVKVGEEYGNTPLQNYFGMKIVGNILAQTSHLTPSMRPLRF